MTDRPRARRRSREDPLSRRGAPGSSTRPTRPRSEDGDAAPADKAQEKPAGSCGREKRRPQATSASQTGLTRFYDVRRCRERSTPVRGLPGAGLPADLRRRTSRSRPRSSRGADRSRRSSSRRHVLAPQRASGFYPTDYRLSRGPEARRTVEPAAPGSAQWQQGPTSLPAAATKPPLRTISPGARPDSRSSSPPDHRFRRKPSEDVVDRTAHQPSLPWN